MLTEAISILSIGLLMFFISLPLAYRKVPMNSLYGIRIPAAFESEQRWYDINAYGGRQMAIWAWLIMVVGVAGFFLPEGDSLIYILGSTVVVLLAVLIPVVRIIQWARRLPEGVSQTSTMPSSAMTQTSEVVSVSSISQKRTLIPAIVLGLLCVAYVIYIDQSAQWLPERVATHFGASGRANDWMSRESYRPFFAMLGPAIAGIIGLFGVVIAILQPSMKSRVAGSSCPQNLSYLGGDILWFACLLLCFLAGTHRLVVEANRSHPAHLPGTGLGMLVAAFALGNIAWAALLIFHVMKKAAITQG